MDVVDEDNQPVYLFQSARTLGRKRSQNEISTSTSATTTPKKQRAAGGRPSLSTAEWTSRQRKQRRQKHVSVDVHVSNGGRVEGVNEGGGTYGLEEAKRAQESLFVPLFDRREPPASLHRREQLFHQLWSGTMEKRIQKILRESNQATLDSVSQFFCAAASLPLGGQGDARSSMDGSHSSSSKQTKSLIPSAFIVTGPNIASQDLLFSQLQEMTVLSGQSTEVENGNDHATSFSSSEKKEPAATVFVRLRSTEAGNIKAILKKIIRDATTQGVHYGSSYDEDEDSEDETDSAPDPQSREADDEDALWIGRSRRKYLDYDLEALYDYLVRWSQRSQTRKRSQAKQRRHPRCEHVFVAFQDSEAFDSGLLSDLITLFHSWRDQIPFSLLFGVATSVELLQARLYKAACRLLYGAQFDVAQASTILHRVVEQVIVSCDAPLRLGPTLLQSFLDRQTDHVAGVHVFVRSLQYAYMCHFYANPLSGLLLLSHGVHDDDDKSEKGVKPPIGKEQRVKEQQLWKEAISPKYHLRALRTLPSFRFYIEQLLEKAKERVRDDGKNEDSTEGDEEDIEEAGDADGQEKEHVDVDCIPKLLRDDDYFLQFVYEEMTQLRSRITTFVRRVHLVRHLATPPTDLKHLYIAALAQGISAEGLQPALEAFRATDPSGFVDVVERLRDALADDTWHDRIRLPTVSTSSEASQTGVPWTKFDEELRELHEACGKLMQKVPEGSVLRSRHAVKQRGAAASRTHGVVDASRARTHPSTTTIMKRVSASMESLATSTVMMHLAEAYTGLLDRFTWLLVQYLPTDSLCAPSSLFHEVWFYDSRVPSRDVFLPRPKLIFERALTRPHEYLNCRCCGPTARSDDDEVVNNRGIASTAPPTSILYQLYLEAGNLINVADLWTAFFEIVQHHPGLSVPESEAETTQEKDDSSSSDDEEGEEEEEVEVAEGDDKNSLSRPKYTRKQKKLRERVAWMLFYRGLAELRALGYVKPSGKKTDHVAKVRWM